jgi:hypothetical protein
MKVKYITTGGSLYSKCPYCRSYNNENNAYFGHMAQSIEDNSMPLKEHQEYQEQQEQQHQQELNIVYNGIDYSEFLYNDNEEQHAFFRRLVNFVHQ